MWCMVVVPLKLVKVMRRPRAVGTTGKASGESRGSGLEIVFDIVVVRACPSDRNRDRISLLSWGEAGD